MTGLQRLTVYGALSTFVLLSGGTAARAVPYTARYEDGATWDTIFGQGFNPAVSDAGLENPPYEFGEPVPLTRWEFFKSGEADAASNIRLAIIEPLYADITGLNANDPNGPVVGLSTNTIASTAGIATGAPIRFNFAGGLELIFGNYYGAIMVNDDGSGNLTPVLVSGLTADYIETDPNVFIPETNYDIGTDPNGRLMDPEIIDFNTSASNFMHTDDFGTFFDGFGGGGDANFIAYFDTTFPPESPPGDFDGDLDVDGDDLALWEADYGVNNESDADEDGDSDGIDFLIWQRNYTGPLPPPLAAVPEPGSFVLACALGLVGILTRLSRRRSGWHEKEFPSRAED